MTKRSPEREQFLANILTTAVEGGINYWAAVSEYRHEYCKPPVTIAETSVKVHEFEPEEGETDENGYAEEGVLVTIDTIAKGIGVLAKSTGYHAGYWKEFWLANRTNSEDGDYDAGIADSILQAGIFGEVIYG